MQASWEGLQYEIERIWKSEMTRIREGDMRENNGGKYVRLSVMMFVQFAAVGFVGLFSEEKYRADVEAIAEK